MENKTVKYRQEVIDVTKINPSKYFQYFSPSEVLTSNAVFTRIHHCLCVALIVLSIIKIALCFQEMREDIYFENESLSLYFTIFMLTVNCINIFLPIYSLVVTIFVPKVGLYFLGLGFGIIALLVNFVRIAFRSTEWQHFMDIWLLISNVLSLTLLYGVVFSIGVMLKSLQLSRNVKIVNV